ncbi:MAG: helix-turn-helix domain-containing protein [Pseudonocardiaceae bacterium]
MLWAARHRTASRTSPDRGLSRQELAELVNTWVWDHHKETLEHSANWIGALERGKIRWPRTLSRKALRAILDAPTDAALGFTGDPRSARAAETLDNVDRQQLLRTSRHLGVLAALGPVAAYLEGGEPTPTPRRIGATDIAQVRAAARVFESWGDSYGGNGFSRETVMDQLRWSAALRGAICPDELRPELHSALGDLAGVAGYLAVDAGADEQAAAARTEGNPRTQAIRLTNLASLTMATGDPPDPARGSRMIASSPQVPSSGRVVTWRRPRSWHHAGRGRRLPPDRSGPDRSGGVPLWRGTTPGGERVCECLTRCSLPRLRLAASRAAPHRLLLAAGRIPATHPRGRGPGRCGGYAAPMATCTCCTPTQVLLATTEDHAQALCGQRIPAHGLTITHPGAGALCMTCVAGVPAGSADPGPRGTTP